MTAPPGRAIALLFLWLGLLFTTFELFLFLDWGQGVLRVALLGVIAALVWVWRRWAPGLAAAPAGKSASSAVRVLLVVGILANLGPWMYFVRQSHVTQTVQSDQADTVLAGLRVLRDRMNPYAVDTVTDSFAYDLATESLAAREDCRVPGAPVRFRVGRADAGVVPRIADAGDCGDIGRMFSSLGFKYGPVMLAFYLPFVAALGTAGFLTAHLVLVVVTCVLLYRSAYASTGTPFWAEIALLPFLWPTVLAWNVLAKEHLDFVPLFLVTLAWLAARDRRYWVAALFIGVSLAAKFLPALLFLPLLAPAPRRVWPVPFLIAAACFAPFVLSDATGVWHNVGYPFTRPPDSTALVYFCPSWLRIVVRCLALAIVAGAALRAQRMGWAPLVSLEYLLAAHLAVLASGTALHNNYLVWLLPLLSLYLSARIGEAMKKVGTTT